MAYRSWRRGLVSARLSLIAEPVAIEVVVIGFAHVLFIVRIALARRHARRQRALDLERFQRIRDDSVESGKSGGSGASGR